MERVSSAHPPCVALPLLVHIDPQFCNLSRLHEWDDPGWYPKHPATIRSYAAVHWAKDKLHDKEGQ